MYIKADVQMCEYANVQIGLRRRIALKIPIICKSYES